jgi:hypothetical protein
MSTELTWERALAAAAMRALAPGLRAAVLERSEFRERFGLANEAVIDVGSIDAQFLRSELFDAARQVLSHAAPSIQVRSRQGDAWSVMTASPHGIKLAREGTACVLPEAACLSPDAAARQNWFKQACDCPPLESRLAAWRELLAQRALSDSELQPLLSDLRIVPWRVCTSIRRVLASGSFGPAEVVPADLRYFDLLSSPPENGVGLREYIAAAVAAHVRSLIGHYNGEGLKMAFLLGSHSGLAEVVDFADVEREQVVGAFAWIASHGDRVSQVAAIECGLRWLGDWPELESSLVSMARDIAADDPDDPGGRLQLASSLVALVEGEVARRSVARERPPFWRRLVTTAHAGTLEREILSRGLDRGGVAKWALEGGGALYYLQTLVDLRQEPRWFPDFIAPHQLKAEWIGRVWSAAEKYRASVPVGELSEILWGESPTSIKSQLVFPDAWLPGPLEGGVEAVRDLPEELEAQIRASLEAEELTPVSFYGLVNASLLLRVDSRLSGLAAQGLRRVGYQLRQVGVSESPFPLLHGLAKVAAVTRSAELAGEVRILVRAVRRGGSKRLSPEAYARIALVAVAAHSEKGEWINSFGDWLGELAFSEMTVQEAVNLQSDVHMLLHIEPDLWGTCGRAEAALAAFIAAMPDTQA